MAKGKNFAQSLGSKRMTTLIPSQKKQEEKTRSETETENNPAPAKKKKNADTTVTTFRVKNDLLFAVKAVAYWERKKIQQVFNGALTAYLETLPPADLKKAKEAYERNNV